MKGFDSAAPLDPAAVKADGGEFVGRYVSDYSHKNITSAEFQAYTKAGLDVILFAENGTSDWQLDADAAKAFGRRCRGVADSAGVPSSQPLFVTFDSELSPEQFAVGLAYVRNFNAGAGGDQAAYGQKSLMDYLLQNGVRWACQAGAWNSGASSLSQVDQVTTAYQPGLGQVDVDIATSLPGTTPAPSQPSPAESDYQPVSAPSFPGRDLYLETPHLQGDDVLAWQKQMNVRGWKLSEDGVYGADSQLACILFQEYHSLKQDGVIGATTWRTTWEAPKVESPPA